MKKLLEQHPYLLCGLGQIRYGKRLRGWILGIAFWDCVGISIYFLFVVKHPLGVPIGLLCVLLAGLLWFYSYLDYLELAPGAATLATSGLSSDCYEAGRIAYLRGELDEARSHFQKALKVNRDDWDALYQLARVHFELGEPKKACRLFERYANATESRKWSREAEEYLAQLKGQLS